jgi:hypothetical protein
MAFGKPVIGTSYSGNLDFMNSDNSFLARYALTQLAKDRGPYRRGAVWAEPDIEHAASLMRSVYVQRDAATLVGARAREDVLKLLQPATVGARVKSRLQCSVKEVRERSIWRQSILADTATG